MNDKADRSPLRMGMLQSFRKFKVATRRQNGKFNY